MTTPFVEHDQDPQTRKLTGVSGKPAPLAERTLPRTARPLNSAGAINLGDGVPVSPRRYGKGDPQSSLPSFREATMTDARARLLLSLPRSIQGCTTAEEQQLYVSHWLGLVERRVGGVYHITHKGRLAAEMFIYGVTP